MRIALASLVVLLFVSASAHAQRGRGAAAAPADGGANGLGALHFRPLGPEGNRVASITGVPGDPLTVYIGAADGGIWKTTDAGITWRPIFDDKDVSAIGALAVAPSAHDTVWAGTGEPWLIRPVLHARRRRLQVDRRGTHVAAHGPGRDGTHRAHRDRSRATRTASTSARSARRSVRSTSAASSTPTDGGATWQQVLAVNENTGCSDLAMDPRDPKTLYAGMWQLIIHRYDLHSGGLGSGVYVTHDGGATWSKITGHGLPAADHAARQDGGRRGAEQSESRLRARAGRAGAGPLPLERSRRDLAARQSIASAGRALAATTRAWPCRPTTRICSTSRRSRSRCRATAARRCSRRARGGGGGAAVRGGGRGRGAGARRIAGAPAPPISAPGGDNHDVWIDPTNANRVLVANDAGVAISDNRAASYRHFLLPISQVYHVMADNAVPYNVMGNIQDKSSFRGPNRGGGGRGGMGVGNWTSTGGCEDAFAVPDPVDADVVWSGCDNGRVVRMDYKHGMARDVSAWPITSYGWAPADMKYRWDWITPIAISPHDHNRVYVGAQVVFMTTNGGQSWKVISPDLTTNDKSHQGNSGGITSDNLTTFDGATLYAIAESPVKAGVIWTGSTDGQVNVTQDAGAHWTNVTKNIPNLPPWGTVWSIAPSKFDAGTAYVVENLQHEGIYDALVYKTSDYGATWKLISSGVPKGVNSSAHIIVEDPGAARACSTSARTTRCT